jgi:hypothetical protein
MLSHLNLKRPVACPVAQAPQFLERFFADYAVDDAAVLALRVPIVLPGLPLLMLARDCVIRLTRVHDEGAMIASYAVEWAPVAGGPFPRFTGRLSLPNADDYESCFIALDGAYEPPLGALGEAFDRTIGRAIAESTGRDLLQRIGTFMEQSSRSVETAKANKRAAAGL